MRTAIDKVAIYKVEDHAIIQILVLIFVEQIFFGFVVFFELGSKEVLILNEKKTGKRREIPLGKELSENLKLTYKKLGSPCLDEFVVPITIRAVNKQIKIHSVFCNLASNLHEFWTKSKHYKKKYYDPNQ
jgi:hypothetical protein